MSARRLFLRSIKSRRKRYAACGDALNFVARRICGAREVARQFGAERRIAIGGIYFRR